MTTPTKEQIKEVAWQFFFHNANRDRIALKDLKKAYKMWELEYEDITKIVITEWEKIRNSSK